MNFYSYLYFISRAIVDFCCHQRNLFQSWQSPDISLYQQLVTIIVSILNSPDLEIADMAVDALPALFPDVSKTGSRYLATCANNGVKQGVKNLLQGMIFHNVKNPDFKNTHEWETGNE